MFKKKNDHKRIPVPGLDLLNVSAVVVSCASPSELGLTKLGLGHSSFLDIWERERP